MRYFFVLVFLSLLASVSFGQKRAVTISPFTIDGKVQLLPLNQDNSQLGVKFSVPLLTEAESELPIKRRGLSPQALVSVVWFPDRDTSDSALTISSKNTDGRANTGIYIFPARIGTGTTATALIGPAQFFEPEKGELEIDSIGIFIQVFENAPLRGDLQLIPFSYTGKLRGAGAIYQPSFNDLTFYGSPNTLNGAEINGRTTSQGVQRTVTSFSPSVKIPANESFGFTCFQDPQVDTLYAVIGTFQWEQKDSTLSLGAQFARNTAGEDFLWRAFTIGYFGASSTFRASYPSLVNKGFRTNYNTIIWGKIDEQFVSVEPTSTNAGPMSFSGVFPNPTSSASNVEFSIPSAGNYTLRVVNSAGEVVRSLSNGFLELGTYKSDVNSSSLPSGAYFIVLSNGDRSVTTQLSVIK